MNSADAKGILEAVLLSAPEPLCTRTLEALFDGAFSADDIEQMLKDLQQGCNGQRICLVQVASGWRFQTRPELREYLDRLAKEKPPKYSRAVLETLAVIAYRQTVTRGEMEDIRGVAINSLLLKQLEDRGWIEIIGHQEGVGRPALYSTTRQFLDDLSLMSLAELPSCDGVSSEFLNFERSKSGRQTAPVMQPDPAVVPSVASTTARAAAASNENSIL